MEERDNLIGIFWKIFQCLVFTCMVVVIRLLSETEMSHFEMMFGQNLFSFLIIILYFAIKRKKPKKSKKINLIGVRAFLGVMSGLCLFTGVANVPVNMATTISFSYPIFATIFAVIILREVIKLPRIIALITGFAGVLVVLQPWSEVFNAYAIFILMAAFIWGVTDITIKKIIRNDSVETNAFYTAALMFIFTLPLGINYWQMPSLEQVILLMALALCQILNYVSIGIAYRKADITIIMPFDYMRLVFSSIMAFMIFDERLSIWTAIGGFMIAASSVYATYRERKNARRMANNK